MNMKKRIQIQSKMRINSGLGIVALWVVVAVASGLTLSNYSIILLSLPFIVGWLLVVWSLLSDENSLVAKVISTTVLTGTFTWLSIIAVSFLSVIFHGIV